MISSLRFTITTTCLAIVSILAMSSSALQAQEVNQAAQMRPGQIFLSGYTSIEEAQKFEKVELYKHAWNKYYQALRHYQSLSHNFPDWKPEIVQTRIKDTKKEIARVEPLAQIEHSKKQEMLKNYIQSNTSENGIASVELSQKNSKKSEPNTLPAPAKVEIPTHERKHMTGLLQQIKQYQQQIAKLQTQSRIEREKYRRQITALNDKLRRVQQGLDTSESAQTKILNQQIAKLQRQLVEKDNHSKEQLKKLFKLHNELTKKRDQLASAPLRQDVEQLEHEKQRYEAELHKIVSVHKSYLSKYKKMSEEKEQAIQDLKLAKSALDQKNKQLISSKNASHKVITALRDTIKKQQNHITALEKQVELLNSENSDLKNKLATTQKLNKELQNELDSVTLERDKLSQLLNLNDADRAKRMIKESLRLGEQVRKQQAIIKQLIADKNTAQDTIVAEQSKLAVAKQKIINLQSENTDYIRRIAALESSLQNSSTKVSKTLNDPKASALEREEAVELKKALKRLTVKLERKKQAEEILWKEYQKSNTQGTNLGFAIASLVQDKIDLSADERKLLQEKQDTDQFRLPGITPKSPAERQAALARTNAEIESLESLALRCVEKGNLQTAKDIYDEAYDSYGHHYPFFINRAVIRYNLDEFAEAEEIFESGTQLKEKVPYTHYMLGLCRYHLKKDDLAVKSLEQAVALKPDYTDAYLYLGTIAYEQGNSAKAKDLIEKAIRINPDDANAHFNLSLINNSLGMKKEAIKAYHNALQAGFAPDLEYEKQIGINKARH